MLFPFLYRTVRQCSWRVLWKATWNGALKTARSIALFKRRARYGEWFPPFLHLSITSSCNLRCQGCWVDVDYPEERLDLELLNRTVTEAKRHGNALFGILGGEPFLHPQFFDLLAAHPDCYFQVFTNGQPITAKFAKRLRSLGNATPLISIEGLESTSEERRGKREVFQKSMEGLANCTRAGLFTGVATSVCQNNIDDLLSEKWLRRLIDCGVHYVWYYTYRPVGPRPAYDLALTPAQTLRVRQFIVEMRRRMPILIVETYYDGEGRALCPMATGISHHVNPRGEIEPCPILQFARENVRDPRGVYETIRKSEFLEDFRSSARTATRGCIVLERPDLVVELARKHQARDSTSRSQAFAELAAMPRQFSQWLPGYEVAEAHWVYRFAKKYWFNSFGAYDKASHDAITRHSEVKNALDRAACTADSSEEKNAIECHL